MTSHTLHGCGLLPPYEILMMNRRIVGIMNVAVMALLTLASVGIADDFNDRAAQLFSKRYYYDTWNPTDHTVAGEDWSLPTWVHAARYSGVGIDPRRVGSNFPGRIQRTVRTSWREVEPREGVFDFEPIRRRIIQASEDGKYAVKMGLGASVWETRYFKSLTDRTIKRLETGTAPRWLQQYQVPRVEERPNKSIPFQVVNLDIYAPEYHGRYLKMVEAFGRSGIPQMPELDLCYLHLMSASRGEEGTGPALGDPRREKYEARLRSWASAFKGAEYKLCNVSAAEADLKFCLALGMGQRNGFVEHYLLHIPNRMLGQLLDADGYLVVDEQNPLIAENRASGDENEEYTKNHVARFGPIETFPHRYHESMLRVLQMRRNFIWAEGGPWLINPPLLHYVALELGKNAQTAPDAWCYLRQSYVPDRVHKNWKDGIAAKNFERWVYQRDTDGARTVPTERVDVPAQMFDFARDRLYDFTARKTQAAENQTRIRFAVDDAFLSGGPHAVAVKVTYFDHGDACWLLEYHTSSGIETSKEVACKATGTLKTVTFMLDGVCFPGSGYTGDDLCIRAVHGDAVIRMLRLVKMDKER